MERYTRDWNSGNQTIGNNTMMKDNNNGDQNPPSEFKGPKEVNPEEKVADEKAPQYQFQITASLDLSEIKIEPKFEHEGKQVETPPAMVNAILLQLVENMRAIRVMEAFTVKNMIVEDQAGTKHEVSMIDVLANQTAGSVMQRVSQEMTAKALMNTNAGRIIKPS